METRDTVRIGIQKRGGHMFEASCQSVANWWGLEINEEAGIKGNELTSVVISHDRKPAVPGYLLMCRIEDIVANISDGILDIGIVTSDVLSEWEAANRQNLKRDKSILVEDVGAAGSRLMIGVAQTFLDVSPNKQTAWRDAVKLSYAEGLPIFTSFEEDLRQFLKAHNLPIPEIKRRRGTIEAQARLFGAPVIADLVESGRAMRQNGFEPIVPICESRTLFIAKMSRNKDKQASIRELFNRMRATRPPSIMDINRLDLTRTEEFV